MIFHATKLAQVFEIELERKEDERGFFARSWCKQEIESHGLTPQLVQCNVSFNERKGTLRGMHYQAAPHAETKIIRCTRGAIYDVIVDLRQRSATYTRWVSLLLTEEKHNMAYIPEGCAHGFLTLQDQCEVFYQMSEFYHPELSCGVRWDDPAFQIVWPDKVKVISQRDKSYPDFNTGPCKC